MLATRKTFAIIGIIAAALISLPAILLRFIYDAWRLYPEMPQLNAAIIAGNTFVVVTLILAAGTVFATVKLEPKIGFIAFVALAVMSRGSDVAWYFLVTSRSSEPWLFLRYIPLLDFFVSQGGEPLIRILGLLTGLSFWALLALGIVGLMTLNRPVRLARTQANLNTNSATNVEMLGTDPRLQSPSASGIQPQGGYLPATSKSVTALVLSLFIPIAGLIVGYVARSEIRQSQGQLGGAKLAQAAIIIGWIYTGLGILLLIFYVAVSAAFLFPLH